MSEPDRSRARIRGFRIHFLAYLAGSIAAFLLNLVIVPEVHWFVLPLVGWGAVLALHVAYVMGLFDVFSNK